MGKEKRSCGTRLGGIQERLEEEVVITSDDEAEEWMVAAVVCTEAADEEGVGDEAAPALVDGRGAREGGG
jgi:hypothetical protein